MTRAVWKEQCRCGSGARSFPDVCEQEERDREDDLDDAAGFHVLMELDQGLAAGDAAASQACLSSLTGSKSSGLINLLVRTARRLGRDGARFVADHLPY